MDTNRKWVLGAALVAAALVLFGAAAGVPVPADSPGELYYQASCAVVEPDSVDGLVSNLSQDTYQVSGEVRFVFVLPGAIPRPEVLVQADSLIPPGQTARVARARMAFQLRPGETCRFEVKDRIRKT